MKENEPEEVALESSTQPEGIKFGVIPCKAGLPLAAKVQGKAVVLVRSSETITQYAEVAYDTPWGLLRNLLEVTGGSLIQIDTKGIRRGLMVPLEKVVMSGYKMHHNMDLRGTYAITYLVGEWRGKIELPKEAQPEPILSRDYGFMKNAKDTMEAMCFRGATAPPKRSSSESVERSAEQVRSSENTSDDIEMLGSPRDAPDMSSQGTYAQVASMYHSVEEYEPMVMETGGQSPLDYSQRRWFLLRNLQWCSRSVAQINLPARLAHINRLWLEVVPLAGIHMRWRTWRLIRQWSNSASVDLAMEPSVTTAM